MNDSGAISVLLPFGHHDSSDALKLLEKFGLTNLKYVPSDDVESTIEAAIPTKDSARLVTQFDKLFIKNQKEHPVAKKHFLVTGHGGTGASIAGIPIRSTSVSTLSPFGAFVRTIESINSELIYFDSCYLGGPNITVLQNELIQQVQKLFQNSSIACIVIVQATTDELTFGASAQHIQKEGKRVYTSHYFKNFFNNIDRYFAEKNLKLEDIPSKKRLTLADVILPLYETFPSIVRLPSVRLPGSNSFFRPIIVDKIKVITFLDIQRLLTQEIFQQRFGSPGAVFGKNIFIGASIKYVLVYPIVIPANISQASEQPDLVFVSKIPGTSCHIIDSMTFERPIAFSTINNALGNLFLKQILEREKEIETEGSTEKITSASYGESLKAWFIKTVSYYQNEKTYKLEDVIIVKYASPKLKATPGYYGELLYKKNGHYYTCYGDNITSEVQMDEQEYWKRAADILNSSLPDNAALHEATGGGQDRSTINKAVARLFPKITSKRVITDELAKMRNEIASDTSEDGTFAINFVSSTLIPFVKSYHRDFKKSDIDELISLVNKLINDSLAKKRSPTIASMIDDVIIPMWNEFDRYKSEPMNMIMSSELNKVVQYYFLFGELEKLIVDSKTAIENREQTGRRLQNIVNDFIDQSRRNKRTKEKTKKGMANIFEWLGRKINELKDEKTKQTFIEIVKKVQADAAEQLKNY